MLFCKRVPARDRERSAKLVSSAVTSPSLKRFAVSSWRGRSSWSVSARSTLEAITTTGSMSAKVQLGEAQSRRNRTPAHRWRGSTLALAFCKPQQSFLESREFLASRLQPRIRTKRVDATTTRLDPNEPGVARPRRGPRAVLPRGSRSGLCRPFPKVRSRLEIDATGFPDMRRLSQTPRRTN